MTEEATIPDAAAELQRMADWLAAWAEDLRKPLPQGDQDVEAREAVDQQAVGIELAADELRERADEMEGKNA